MPGIHRRGREFQPPKNNNRKNLSGTNTRFEDLKLFQREELQLGNERNKRNKSEWKRVNLQQGRTPQDDMGNDCEKQR